MEYHGHQQQQQPTSPDTLDTNITATAATEVDRAGPVEPTSAHYEAEHPPPYSVHHGHDRSGVQALQHQIERLSHSLELSTQALEALEIRLERQETRFERLEQDYGARWQICKDRNSQHHRGLKVL